MAAEDTVASQGTELFFSATGTAVVKFSCPTGISGLGGGADQIDTTCLDSTEREFRRGFKNPSAISVPFVFLPRDASHQSILDDLNDSGEIVPWMLAFSDGTADPTIAAGVWAAPTGRTSVSFKGYVSDVTIDVATNDVVKGTVTIQRSGGLTWKYKA